jgi:hypothetical protein
MLRFQLPPRPESLNHIPIPYVNNLSAKLMDGKLAERIGADGSRILAAVYEPDAPGWLRDLPMVQRLRLYWVQQFHMKDDKVTWRSAADLPPAGVRPHTPYDPDARYWG